MKSNGINTFHIGLIAADYPGNFEWLDGSITSYRNWVSGFARTFTGKPMFVSVGLNGWFASDENMTAAFMCKYTPGKKRSVYAYGHCCHYISISYQNATKNFFSVRKIFKFSHII